MASILYELAISTNWSTDLSVLKLQDDDVDDREIQNKKNVNSHEDYGKEDSSFDADSHDSNGIASRSLSNVSQLLRNNFTVPNQFVQISMPVHNAEEDFEKPENRTYSSGAIISNEKIGEAALIAAVTQERKESGDQQKILNGLSEDSNLD